MDVKHQYWLDTWMFSQPFHHENRKKKSQNLELRINMTEFKLPEHFMCAYMANEVPLNSLSIL